MTLLSLGVEFVLRGPYGGLHGTPEPSLGLKPRQGVLGMLPLRVAGSGVSPTRHLRWQLLLTRYVLVEADRRTDHGTQTPDLNFVESPMYWRVPKPNVEITDDPPAPPMPPPRMETRACCFDVPVKNDVGTTS
jgi:hypothetical protein